VWFTFPFFHGHGFLVGFLWPILVFASHFPIDRWSLADKWLNFIDGRSLSDFVFNGRKGIPLSPDPNKADSAEFAKNYHALRGGFTALVYAVADNTMHLIPLYYGALFLLSR
jgi:hypothetical protein